MKNLHKFRAYVDTVGLVWFLIGNVWMFGGGDPDEGACKHEGKSAVYRLNFALISIQYIHMLLPCIVMILLVPCICLCLPCIGSWLRIVRHGEENGRKAGASIELINTLPKKKYRDLCKGDGDDPTCPICLNDFEAEDELRMLPCSHAFHEGCVDEWLQVNATCPSCRRSVLPADSARDPEGPVSTLGPLP